MECDKIKIIEVIFRDMNKITKRNFITKNTAIGEEGYKISKTYIFWIIPIYKSVIIQPV